jgi:hypothetical protein
LVLWKGRALSVTVPDLVNGRPFRIEGSSVAVSVKSKEDESEGDCSVQEAKEGVFAQFA